MKHFKNAERRKGFGVKAVVLTLAVAVLSLSIVGGTFAWLIDSTGPVKNVFTYGDINIDLEETTGDTYKMLPGKAVSKDPKVTVKTGSEDCWLFVKIDESENAKFSDYMTYVVADGWTRLAEVTDETVYFRTVNAADVAASDAVFEVLAGNEVVVKDTVNKAMLNSLTDQTYPTLTFTAYAVQRDSSIDAIDSAAEAWGLVG